MHHPSCRQYIWLSSRTGGKGLRPLKKDCKGRQTKFDFSIGWSSSYLEKMSGGLTQCTASIYISIYRDALDYKIGLFCTEYMSWCLAKYTVCRTGCEAPKKQKKQAPWHEWPAAQTMLACHTIGQYGADPQLFTHSKRAQWPYCSYGGRRSHVDGQEDRKRQRHLLLPSALCSVMPQLIYSFLFTLLLNYSV